MARRQPERDHRARPRRYMLTIAKDDHSLSLSTLIALDIAAETIRLLLDEDDITKGHHWPNSSSQGVPGMVARPRHRHHRGPMGGAVHPRRIGLQHHLHRAPIQPPPPAPTRTPVIPGRPAAAATTTPRNTTARPHPRHHQRLALGVFLLELLELDVHGALV